ncbi:SsrA-binding protein SmpB [Mesoterricola sediminis]|uniref:SsrA-binding protein n=1 Tax=Mesoterricola sediminis TaxID=2927980 RepID=A0AA48H2L7_9BACT|nr:SsrA-binding protein SmpB [Mesoterricola sediminis]BDU78482.1 SsrA-binding protein [Mesoterricola sediminis]
MSEDLVRNRKATHVYTILDTWEAGIALVGTEVKALRGGHGQLQDAYVDGEKGELWLKQANISPYAFGTYANHDPLRPRKLLLNRAEITKILARVDRKGLTIVPLAIYLNPRGRIKVRIGLAEGKTMGDKREALKERENKRELDRIRKGDRE